MKPQRYKDNVLAQIEKALAPLGVIDRALDVGAGDGYIASRLLERGCLREVTPVEVLLRPNSELTPILYDGRTLPFEDRTFDLAYAVDVVHHSQEPARTLRELARCSRRYLLLKDHTYSSPVGFAFLSMLDEIGNRRFGVPSLYRYQRGFAWFATIEAAGFRLVHLNHPAPCERGVLGYLTNRFQFVAIWERDPSRAV